MSLKTSGIILAAGDGLRFGAKKQFLKLKGKEIWKWSADTAKKVLDEVVVVGVDFPGGKTRQESVKIGLEHITGDKVIIFDAARPLVSEDDIIEILETLKIHPSVCFAKSPTNTIILKKDYSRIRENCQELLVPQGFDTVGLNMALENAKNNHDETESMQDEFGVTPFLISKEENNLYKITTKEDLKIIEALCEY